MRWLLTGATGLLGGYVLRQLRSESIVAWSGSQQSDVLGVPLIRADLADSAAVAAAFSAAAPDVVIHAAAVARVDECRRDSDRARRINTEGSRHLAELAAERGARLVYVSTDLVFDGERGSYRESDSPSPLTVYGLTKADAETAVLTFPRTAVARLSLLYGPCLTGRSSFFDRMVAALKQGQPIPLFADEWRTPLDLATAATALVELGRSEVTGLLHIGGPERLSRLEMGRQLAEALGVSGDSI
ncbi:MAG TPA: SDR family oxidoreductase, partial [Gemmataceae bacterium]|nr:SDR family oxidoreductase [Gemmataceae bacterium]